MAKVNSWGNYNYEPHSLVRKAARTASQDQTNAQAANRDAAGKLGGLGKKVTGGAMNGGGKRRPGHDARKGID